MDKLVDQYIEIIVGDFCDGEKSRTCLIVPQGYSKTEIIDILQKKFANYDFTPVGRANIWVSSKKLEDHIRSAEFFYTKYGTHIIDVDQKFSKEILSALASKFPKNKFELISDREIYEGVECDNEIGVDDLSIVIDDFELYQKWHPIYLPGDFNYRLMEKVVSKIENGVRILETKHNEEVVKFLKQKFPSMVFEIRPFSEVFYWLSDAEKEVRKKGSVILVNNFIVPKPKRFK